MKQKKSKKASYFLITLCITCSFMFIKKSNFFQNLSESTILRNLFEQNVTEYICNKAGSRLTDKYSGGFNEDSIEKTKLSEAQQSIVDFARDSSYDNIKPYIKKLSIFIVLLVIDIIFIFFWILYCSCACCNCCCFRKAFPKSKACSTWNFIIAVVCNFLVIIFSIVALSLINPFFKRINGVGCSAFNFLDHVRYGLSPHYPKNSNEWIGINGLINRLNDSYQEIKNIKTNDIDCNLSGKDNTCGEFYTTFNKECNSLKALFNSSFEDIEFNDEISQLRNAYDTFNDAETDVEDDIYDALHDYINSYVKQIFYAIFSLTLILGVLGIIFLILYGCFPNCLFKALYAIIWNISMLFMLLAVVAAVVFGVIGYIAKDGVSVGHYILSSDNINSNDPLVFSTNDDDNVGELIDVCVNGDGNFFKILQETGNIYNNIETLKEKYKDYENILSRIDSCPNDLKSNFNNLKQITNKSLDISYNITNIRCSFAKNDKDIILNEANSWGKRGITLCAFALLVAFLLGISILTGILFVHRYHYKKSDITGNMKNINMNNESKVDIGQENNNNNTTNTNNFNNFNNLGAMDMNMNNGNMNVNMNQQIPK